MMAKPIRALELHYPMIQFLIIEICAEWLHSGTEITPESLFLHVNRRPYPVWLLCQHKSYPVECEHSLMLLLL